MLAVGEGGGCFSLLRRRPDIDRNMSQRAVKP